MKNLLDRLFDDLLKQCFIEEPEIKPIIRGDQAIEWIKNRLPEFVKEPIPRLMLRFKDALELKSGPMCFCFDLSMDIDQFGKFIESILVGCFKQSLGISYVDAGDEFLIEGQIVNNFRRNKCVIYFEPK